MNLHQTVTEFCIRKLAQILYDCVEYSQSDRALTDWQTAEDFVRRNPHVVDLICQLFETQLSAVHKLNCDFKTFDEFCGRAVWTGLYQPLKKWLGLPYKPVPHYTQIRFG